MNSILEYGYKLITSGFNVKRMIREEIVDQTDEVFNDLAKELQKLLNDPRSDWDEKMVASVETLLDSKRDKVLEKWLS